jgi:3'-phosphoadenosine 5'-phosphosulfate (PAPS) 3'-phosphatase
MDKLIWKIVKRFPGLSHFKIMSEEKSLLLKRREQMIANYDNLPELERIYFAIGADLGLINDQLSEYRRVCQHKRREMKSQESYKSVAEFDRNYEDTDEYISLKISKDWIEGLTKMMSGIRVRIDSLRSESKGSY